MGKDVESAEQLAAANQKIVPESRVVPPTAQHKDDREVQTGSVTKSYNLLAAAGAFILWGGWSFYVNWSSADVKMGLISGLTQGVCSFIITLCMTFLIEKQFNYYSESWVKLLVPPLVTVAITGSGLILIHHFIGTPSIIKTVTPALTVALTFAFFTNLKLYKQVKLTG